VTSKFIVKTSRLFAALLAIGLAAFAAPLQAQQADIIRGRVVGPDSQPVAGVLVTATSLTGQVNRTGRTGRDGRYTIVFPGGEGDYWVSFNAIGFGPRRFQVMRTADQEILIADARLTASTATLAAFNVTERAAASRADTVSDVSGTEKNVTDNITDFLNADQMGDLAAMAAAIPGVQLIPGADGGMDGFSILGLGADQNNVQLNGLNFGEGNVPRDANIQISLATSPYDVSRGGFSGGQLQIRTGSGSNFKSRSLSNNIAAPPLQWSNRVAQAAGNEFTNVSLGGAASGPISPDILFYSVSGQFDRRQADLRTLLSTSPLGFEASGMAADSVNRFLDILSNQQVPVAVAGFPGQAFNDRASFLTSLNWNPNERFAGQNFALSVSGNVSSTRPAGGGFGGGRILSTPSREGERESYGTTVQARHSAFFSTILSETNVGYSISQNDASPYLLLPAGSVRVNSTLADGSASVQNIQFGGAPNLNAGGTNGSLSFLNTLSWFSASNRHRVKLTTEARREAYTTDLTNNELGSFQFNSLADLEAGKPSAYSRQLTPRVREGSQFVGAVSLGDAWRPTNNLQVQYGVRVDGNQFLMGPAQNPLVDSLFGFNNSDVPSKLYVSPRVGFSWTYGTADQVALIPGMVRAPRAVIRGGIGIFQNTPGTQLIGGAIDNTGLPSGLQQLNCIGAAAPSPEWVSYLNDRGLIPTTCADGTSGTVFANSVPNVTLFDPSFLAQRSLRSNLSWSGAVLKNRFMTSVDLTYSRNMAQASTFDLNFVGDQQFTLEDEGGRPIFVPTSAIVPGTGQVAWRQARVVDAFGRVTQQRSDLASESKQISFSLRPITISQTFGWGVSYVFADVQQQFNGFQSTVGDPFTKEWGRASGNARHQFQYNLSYNFFDAVRVNWGGNILSGTPYTATVANDVNGDSYGNDRAFIFDPATASDPALAAGIQSLLNSGTREAKDCLRSQMGRLAGRNTCEGPWTTTAFLSLSLNSVRVGLPQRANLSIQIQNPLAGLDRILHGQDNIKGWGMNINPAQQLLFVRGFDPATQRFKYEVNERFGSTRVSQSSNQPTPSITMQMRYDIGPSRERQQLEQQLDRGRSRPGNKPSVQQLRGLGNQGLINPMQQILQQADSLKLTRKQADSLVMVNRMYVLTTDSLWLPVAKELAALPDKYDEDLAYRRYREAREDQVDMLMAIVPGIKGLLTPEQIRLLPAVLQANLDIRTLRAIRSGTQGQGGRGGMGGMGGMGGGGGGGGGGGRGR
jgi:hypothetical protein